jgi:hypothetical protein
MRTMIGMATAVLLTLSGCTLALQGAGLLVNGSGVTKEESREVPAFTGVEVTSAFEANVSIGPKASVTLNVEDNLLPLIKTDVKDGRLIVRFESGYNIQSTKPMKVQIVVPTLDFVGGSGASKLIATAGDAKAFKIDASGASSIKVDGLASDTIGVQATGASRVIFKGHGTRLTLDVSGASKVSADEATFESAKAQFSGASHGDIKVTGTIEADLSGASSLKVQGNPSIRKAKISGASSVSY